MHDLCKISLLHRLFAGLRCRSGAGNRACGDNAAVACMVFLKIGFPSWTSHQSDTDSPCTGFRVQLALDSVAAATSFGLGRNEGRDLPF
jgi:hypothetical protein